jgi:N-acyl-D-amino-acid deacylase
MFPRLIRGPFVALLAFSMAPGASRAADPVAADWLLKGGTIHDGSGAAPVVGDVAIKGAKIVGVGRFETNLGAQVVDCAGLVVCPGFIDLHTHSDKGVVEPGTRANVNYLTQGCTTSVTGNCGFGPVDVADYFKKVDSAGSGTNVIHLLPHGSLRSQVVGSERQAATPEQLAKMKELAEKAMADGAYGMSTGLIYVPGTYADTDELAAIAEVVGAKGGIYASHIRNESGELLDAVREALEIGRRGKLPVHISHFKASGKDSWGGVRAAAALIEEARKDSRKVTADQYPYIASSTSLEAMVIPAAARAGGNKALLGRLADPVEGPKIRAAIAKSLASKTEETPIRIARYAPRPDWVGKSMAEIARSEKRDGVDIVVEIQQNGGASAVSFGMSEEDVRYAMRLDWVATASDGSAMLPSADRPHPRNYGTFSRKIGHYALAEKVLPLEAAIKSATSLPAAILGLSDRGLLKDGFVADVAVFDPKTFKDQATFEDPFRYSTGIRHVFVGGQPAIYQGTPTGALAGRALRKTVAK